MKAIIYLTKEEAALLLKKPVSQIDQDILDREITVDVVLMSDHTGQGVEDVDVVLMSDHTGQGVEDIDFEAEDEAEIQRRDEKCGTYPERADIAN